MQRLNSLEPNQEQKDHKQQKINPLLDQQIDNITNGIPNNFNKSLRMLSEDHIKTIISYITALNTEIHLSTNYRKDIIQLLTKFSKSHADNINKTDTKDPYHKWIGTYNIYRVHLLRFFKWLHAPHVELSKRPKPAVVENIPKL